MNKKLIAIAVGAAFAIPGVALADVKVYGKFNIGIDDSKDEIGLTKNNDNTGNPWGAPSAPTISGKQTKYTAAIHDQNDSSRLGFKGDEALGLGDLKAIFQLEYGVDPFGDDNGANKPFTERNIFVGLQGGFGTIKGGRFDTPVKAAGERVDQFNDEAIGDDKNLFGGETRISNIIQYSTPKFGDIVTVNVAVVPGEGRNAVDKGTGATVDHGLADTYYASVVADYKWIYGFVAYAGNEPGGLAIDKGASAAGTAGTLALDIIRAGVSVKPIGDLELGALFQQVKGVDEDDVAASANAGDLKDTSYLLSAGYTLSALKLKAEWGQTKGDNNDAKRNLIAVGVDYKLSKSFTTQLYYINYKDKDRAVTYNVDAATPTPTTITINDPKTTSFGLGVVYNF